MKVEDFDTYIIQYGNVYLISVAYEDTGMCRLSENKYDALRIPDPKDAVKIAKASGGKAVKFNPITGSVSQ